MEYFRRLNLLELLAKKSFFLLGPRSTGKSTLVHQHLAEKAVLIDLLESDYFIRLSQRPQVLEDIISIHSQKKIVVIDEIQKIPALLDEVHRLIEKKGTRFLLTGSSARKLRGHQSNLLAGRARVTNLFPLTWDEIGKHFNLERYLLHGGLPQVYTSDEPLEELIAYSRTYLTDEIRAEALVRKIAAFSRFLEVAALSHGQLLNFTEIGNDSAVSPSTVREYYQVLEDTMMGYLLLPWKSSKKRKAIQTAKFYFFDIGVGHVLANVKSLDRNSNLYGLAFEHFIGMELRAFLGYTRIFEDLSFWRSVNGQEVDYVIGDQIAVEVKATQKVGHKHLKGLLALAEEKVFKKYYLVSQDGIPTKHGPIECLPWENFLQKLWGREII